MPTRPAPPPSRCLDPEPQALTCRSLPPREAAAVLCRCPNSSRPHANGARDSPATGHGRKRSPTRSVGSAPSRTQADRQQPGGMCDVGDVDLLEPRRAAEPPTGPWQPAPTRCDERAACVPAHAPRRRMGRQPKLTTERERPRAEQKPGSDVGSASHAGALGDRGDHVDLHCRVQGQVGDANRGAAWQWVTTPRPRCLIETCAA